MALNVVSNFAANVAHRNLAMSDAAASTSLTKLSSGSRVVSAKDDAASLAIGSRLRAEVVAMKTAKVNAGQAGSMLQIADGALATISDVLVRMKELAVQSSSGQFSATERTILDSEFQALKNEVTRISDDTEFNGTQLIAGGSAVFTSSSASATTSELAGGAAPGIKVTFDSTNLDTNKVSDNDAFRLSYDYTAATSQNLVLTNLTTGDRQTIDVEAAIDAVLAARGTPGTPSTGNLVAGESVTVDFANLGVKVSLDEFFDRTNDIITEGELAVTGTLTVTTGTVNYDNNGGVSNVGLVELAAATSYAAATGLLTLQVASSGAGDATMAATNGMEFSLNGGSYAATTADFDLGVGTTVSVRLATSQEVIATLTLSDVERTGGTDTLIIDVGQLAFGVDYTTTGTSTTFDFKVGTGNQTYDKLSFTISSASATALSISGNDILTAAKAETASTAVSAAIDTLNTTRSVVGASQNRLTFAAQNLSSAIENAEAARSTLLDLDVAAEMTIFTSKQVLLQTGIAMLAQANQLPQNLLRLFQ